MKESAAQFLMPTTARGPSSSERGPDGVAPDGVCPDREFMNTCTNEYGAPQILIDRDRILSTSIVLLGRRNRGRLALDVR